MREVTERQEGVEAGTAKLVGTSFEGLVSSMRELLENKAAYASMANAVNPYGNGTTSKKIVEILKTKLADLS
jgi:UDP-N-acetylglucosamine 2-epimerase (non-hydrolysing)